MEWKPANRDRFEYVYDKAAAAVLTLPTEDGGEKNHAIVAIYGEDIGFAPYAIYSRVLARYLSSLDFENSAHQIDILQCVVDSFKHHIGEGEFVLLTHHPLYGVSRCWCISVTPTLGVRTFMEIIEDAVERLNMITCDTADLLAVLDTNAESGVGADADMGNWH